MAAENAPYHYNYRALDIMLRQNHDPKELGKQLDEVMSDLVDYAGKDDTYLEYLPERHHILRELRDIFWNLKREADGNH